MACTKTSAVRDVAKVALKEEVEALFQRKIVSHLAKDLNKMKTITVVTSPCSLPAYEPAKRQKRTSVYFHYWIG